MLDIVQNPKYGDGNILETMVIGDKDNRSIHLRDVPMETLYPTVMPAEVGGQLYAEDDRVINQIKEHGLS